MLDLFAKAVFILSTLLFAYHHLGFLWLLRWMASRRKSSAAPRSVASAIDDAELPTISIIVPVYNEANVIAEKIRNLCAIDYPDDKHRVVMVLDGCTDESAAIAALTLQDAGNPENIELQVNRRNCGKLQILNESIAREEAKIVALSDASAVVDADALRLAAAHFMDEDVGVVCATYKLKYPSGQGEAKYWDFQTKLKAYEAAVAAPMGAHGAFYLFRRSTWSPLKPETINDDFVLPMKIVADGYRAVYDESIVAWELERTTSRQDFSRRVRIGAGNMQQFVEFAGLLNPWRRAPNGDRSQSARLALVFGSGKALRVLIPFIAVIGALACLHLSFKGYDEFTSIAISGLIVSGLGTWAVLWPGPRVPKLLTWLGYLFVGHFATLVGALKYLWFGATVKWAADDEAHQAEYIPLAIRVGKRGFDLVFSMLALILLWPLFIPIAIAVKLESSGPVFYRQRRVGRIWGDRTEVFELVKFRTMYENAEAVSGVQWATKNDPRITKVGLFLRKTRLDELPQFLNVMAGEMSLIGPRPERPQLISGLEQQLPLYVERTYGLRPGITGLAQINQGYDETIDDVRNKLLYDHAYAAHLSRPWNWLKMDFKIVFGTVWVMLTGRGQ